MTTITMQQVQFTRKSADELFTPTIRDRFPVGLNGHAIQFPSVVVKRDAKGNTLEYVAFEVETNGKKVRNV